MNIELVNFVNKLFIKSIILKCVQESINFTISLFYGKQFSDLKLFAMIRTGIFLDEGFIY